MADAAQRRAYLQALGVQPWVRRDAESEAVDAAPVAAPVVAPEPLVVEEPSAGKEPSVVEELPSADVATTSVVSEAIVETQASPSAPNAAADRGGDAELAATAPSTATPDMTAASTESPAVEPPPAEPPAADMPATFIDTLDWDALQTAVAQCTACELHATRTQPVFGVGDRRAEWMIVGEAPGSEEDQQGEPFVGRAGQLLNNMLRATGLSREQVYIANVIKCHPPGDRNPHVDEINQCFGYLQRQIALVQPKLILVVGRVAAHALLKVNGPLGSLRGQVHQFAGIPLVVTYHPAYLLRKPSEKAKSWDDLRLARRIVAGATAEG